MVEPATEADLPGLCDLLTVLFTQEAEFVPSRINQTAGLRMILDSPDVGTILVARDGPHVIGMVNVLFLPSTALGRRVALIEDMVVAPNHRGRGLGSHLLQAAIAYVEANDGARITLLTDGDNQAAQCFYQRHGFAHSTMIPMRLQLDTHT